MRARLLNQESRVGERIRLRLPRCADAPDAGKAGDMRRGKAKLGSRSIRPPAPARGPRLALTGESRQGRRDLAIDRRIDTDQCPVGRALRYRGALDNDD